MGFKEQLLTFESQAYTTLIFPTIQRSRYCILHFIDTKTDCTIGQGSGPGEAACTSDHCSSTSLTLLTQSQDDRMELRQGRAWQLTRVQFHLISLPQSPPSGRAQWRSTKCPKRRNDLLYWHVALLEVSSEGHVSQPSGSINTSSWTQCDNPSDLSC